MCGWDEVRRTSLGTHKISHLHGLCSSSSNPRANNWAGGRVTGRQARQPQLPGRLDLGAQSEGCTLSGGLCALGFICPDISPSHTGSTLTGSDQRSCLSVTPFTRSGGGVLSCPHSQSGEKRLDSDLLEPRAPCHTGPCVSHSLGSWLSALPADPGSAPQACLWRERMPS